MILKQLVEKAESKGCNIGDIQNCTNWFIHHRNTPYGCEPILVIDHTYTKPDVIRECEGLVEEPPHKRYGIVYHYSPSDLLFDHDFMRAVCGEDDIEFGGIFSRPAYIYHIFKVADIYSADERLDYMKQFIGD